MRDRLRVMTPAGQGCRLAWTAVFVVALGVTAWGAHDDQRSSRRDSGKWWLSERVKDEVGLSDEQSVRIEAIFQEALPAMRTERRMLEDEESLLAGLLASSESEESEIITTIDRVERARSSLAKTRTLMLFRMYRVLSPDQRTRLEAMSKRSESRRSRDTANPPDTL